MNLLMYHINLREDLQLEYFIKCVMYCILHAIYISPLGLQD